jgi:hypothetical protein
MEKFKKYDEQDQQRKAAFIFCGVQWTQIFLKDDLKLSSDNTQMYD